MSRKPLGMDVHVKSTSRPAGWPESSTTTLVDFAYRPREDNDNTAIDRSSQLEYKTASVT